MNRRRESWKISVLPATILARDLLLVHVGGRRVYLGYCPHTPGDVDTLHKMLKTKRLWAFQVDSRLPFFRQAADWQKRETLWVN